MQKIKKQNKESTKQSGNMKDSIKFIMEYVYGVDISRYSKLEIQQIHFYYKIGMFKKIQNIIYKKHAE